jgi:ferredoxin
MTFGKRLFTDEKCIGCGWCAEKCPALNIRIQDGRPVFGRKCVMCFGCIYGCPKNAIQARSLRFTLIKTGFNIGAIEKKALQKTGSKDDFPKGILWKGIRKYLEADERRI